MEIKFRITYQKFSFKIERIRPLTSRQVAFGLRNHGGWWEYRVGGGLTTSILEEAEGYAMSAVRLLLVSLEIFRRPHYGT